ncbi:MAG: TIGR04168 family protein [Leptolyngbya sp. SIO4C1]|nr:TIGR04168 family protein [Leptolyngbya sp. SIO4C1]
MEQPRSLTIAAIGDIHEQWEAADADALLALKVDLALFVGDFGNEAVDIVRQVAAVPLPKAVILGNHDAHYSASRRGRKRCPYDREQEDRVAQQLSLLGDCHVGYGQLDLPRFHLSVVGGRPYSWGGPKWRNADFYLTHYGVSDFTSSADKIMAAVDRASCETLLFLGHNGPFGLGEQPHDPCGKDWQSPGGDYGDPDFAEAIAYARAQGRQIPLVTFGHMHHRLKTDPQRLRTRLVVDQLGTVYLNAANVPRIRDTAAGQQRSFFLISLTAGQIDCVRLVWVNPHGDRISEEVLFKRAATSLNLLA